MIIMSLSGWNVKRREQMINLPGDSFIWKGFDVNYTPPKQHNAVGNLTGFQMYISDQQLTRHKTTPLQYAQNAYNEANKTRQEHSNLEAAALNRRSARIESATGVVKKPSSILG
jgi:hypothetical protein